jgi:hypothetical protein
LPNETICVLLALWVLRRAFKRTCIGPRHRGILCHHLSFGDFRRISTGFRPECSRNTFVPTSWLNL